MSERPKKDARGLLVLAAIITVVLWQHPIGLKVLYPFTLLATYAHEMGHGLTALLVGGHFGTIEMHFDGSGLARWGGDVGRLGRGLVAAGGLVGPSIAGATVLVISRNRQRAPILLWVFGIVMGATAIIWAKGMFTHLFILAAAAAFIAVAQYAGKTFAPFFVQLIGVQLCLAVYRDVNYMFSKGAVVDGVQRLSDSAAIADALLLPYWFWGGLTAAFSFIVLTFGLYTALRPVEGDPIGDATPTEA